MHHNVEYSSRQEVFDLATHAVTLVFSEFAGFKIKEASTTCTLQLH